MSATSEIGSAWKAAAASKASGGGGGGDKESGSGDSRDEVVQLDGTSFSMYYGQLQHQQNMLQDWVRTGMYQYAFSQNAADFSGATVMDVGTGTGLLAFFSVQAGARKVYAVEMAKEMAACARLLIKGNNMESVIEVLECAVEDTKVEGKVDIIVSEPIGFLLVHERMLESFVKARDMYLKPGGLMMPSQGVIMACPFTDQTLWDEQVRVDPASSIYICVPEISLTTKYLHHHHHHHHHQIESQYAVFFL
jgi:histone-arginine methyltransferase CARM1